MAKVTRFFDVSGAGAADGTTWANRAPLFNSGVMSTIVTAFDFTSDSLEAVIDPGNYTASATPAFTGTTVPSRALPCEYVAGDGAGGLWIPPDAGWTAAEPAWSDAGMPHITCSAANISVFNSVGVIINGIQLTSINTTVRVINGSVALDWVIINHNGNSASAMVYDGSVPMFSNCVLRMNGTAYLAALSSGASTRMLHNVRIEGNPSASSGTRAGWSTGANTVLEANRLVCIGHPGNGVNQTGAGTGAGVDLTNCVMYGNAGDGVLTNGLAADGSRIANSVLVGNGSYGIEVTSTIPAIVSDCRLRNNTSGDVTGPHCPRLNESTAGTDADEFVNVSGAVSTWDLRIKNTSALWGKGYGAGDQPAAVGSSTVSLHPLAFSGGKC